VSAPNKFEALAATTHWCSLRRAQDARLFADEIANDVRWLASGPRAGLANQHSGERTGQLDHAGQSQSDPERSADMICAQVMGNDVACEHRRSSGNFELNVFKPLMTTTSLLRRNFCPRESRASRSIVLRASRRNCTAHRRADEEKLDAGDRAQPAHWLRQRAKSPRKAHAEGSTLKEAALASGLVKSETSTSGSARGNDHSGK